jgi:uncharacterized protein YraI
MNRLTALAALALTALAFPAKAEPFVVRGDNGYMNLRTGPGVGHSIIGTVRNGIVVDADAAQCVPRDDAPGPPWCFVHLRNAEGWMSTGGLVALAQFMPPPVPVVVPVVPVPAIVPAAPAAPSIATTNNNNVTIAPQAPAPTIVISPTIVLPDGRNYTPPPTTAKPEGS